MWRAIGLISSGLTLAAFIVAVAAWVYKVRLDHRERVLKSTPKELRGDAALEVLDASRINLNTLTRDQRYDLAIRQLADKAARFRTTALIVSLLAFLGVGLAVYAIGRAPAPQVSDAPPQTPADARLASAIVGTWQSRAKLPSGTGWGVEDLQYSLARNGQIQWRGNYRFGFASYPILMSGEWHIEDSKLLYVVKQSNVAMIPQGYQGITPIVDITDSELVYRDSGNSDQVTRDPRLQ
jgi:hypothetical protein